MVLVTVVLTVRRPVRRHVLLRYLDRLTLRAVPLGCMHPALKTRPAKVAVCRYMPVDLTTRSAVPAPSSLDHAHSYSLLCHL